MPINVPMHWHQLPQAKAIIARVQDGELRKTTRIRPTCDLEVFVGLTDRADRHLKRLEALRRTAINAAVGHTMQAALDKNDRAMAVAHAETDWETPTVFDVLTGVFALRRAVSVRRAA
ncbi:hypothetical protein GRI97_08230 [Altererythrobacter xixiisoli]|uniref:Uncharacterized protein n=1 Tax=Croceibacterium xixiisoli TaxID=1476466 RepID=A0A6I4TSW9_9SPHN|nr:hypothetical protein [Croceibacterium xixiisoli]MXO98974.1 hypothetical protein [Croceibacterium xixiisoli]